MNPTNKMVQIGSKKFYVAKIMATDAMQLEYKLLKLLAPVAGLMSAFKKEDGKTKIELSSVSAESLQGVISGILEAGQGEALLSLITTLVGYATYIKEGEPSIDVQGNIDLIFQDGTLEMYKLAFEVARINKLLPFAIPTFGNRKETVG